MNAKRIYQKMIHNRNFAQIFFTLVMSAWNGLPEEVVETDTIATFKKHLVQYMNRKRIEVYGSWRSRTNRTTWCARISRKYCPTLIFLLIGEQSMAIVPKSSKNKM
eukprot:g36791.t1